MLITQKTEDEAVIALHDNGLDIALTIEALLEGPQVNLSFMCIRVFWRFMFYMLFFFPQESWSTTGKKKKNRASSVNKKEKEELKNGEVEGGGQLNTSLLILFTELNQNSM